MLTIVITLAQFIYLFFSFTPAEFIKADVSSNAVVARKKKFFRAKIKLRRREQTTTRRKHIVQQSDAGLKIVMVFPNIVLKICII